MISLLYLNSQNEGLLDFIPDTLPAKFLSTPESFTRNTKLSIKETITLICKLTTGGLNRGIRSHTAQFLLDCSKSITIDPSNVCRTRYKIRSSAFKQLFREVAAFAYDDWDLPEYQYKTHTVLAVDGSKFELPSSVELKNAFDSKSLNLENGGRHYPQCLVSTFYDVYRKIPVHRTVQPYTGGDERAELFNGLNEIPQNSLLLSDRGYWGYEVFWHILNSNRHFVARMPSTRTFKQVINFAAGDEMEKIVTVNPTQNFLEKWRRGESNIETPTPITLRLIRYTPPGGSEEIILATSLLDSETFPTKEITELYWDRWQVELFYRDEKCYVETGKFHSKKEDGILQELFASVLMTVVTRYHLFKENLAKAKAVKFQFITAITTITDNLIKLISLPQKEAVEYFKRVIEVISIAKYYKQDRPSNPRVTKAPPNKWKAGRLKKLRKKE